MFVYLPIFIYLSIYLSLSFEQWAGAVEYTDFTFAEV